MKHITEEAAMDNVIGKRTEDTDSGYENTAQRVAREIGLTVTATHEADRCPDWRAKGGTCDHMHGDRYRVTLRKGGRRMAFDFWNSKHDSELGKHLGYYDVLACVSGDIGGPTDPDEVAEEYGPMRPSQAIAAAKHAARLQAFFTEDEQRRLGEIS